MIFNISKPKLKIKDSIKILVNYITPKQMRPKVMFNHTDRIITQEWEQLDENLNLIQVGEILSNDNNEIDEFGFVSEENELCIRYTKNGWRKMELRSNLKNIAIDTINDHNHSGKLVNLILNSIPDKCVETVLVGKTFPSSEIIESTIDRVKDVLIHSTIYAFNYLNSIMYYGDTKELIIDMHHFIRGVYYSNTIVIRLKNFKTKPKRKLEMKISKS